MPRKKVAPQQLVGLTPHLEEFSLAQKLRLLLIGIIVSCGGSFHFGYQISIINPLADVLQGFLEKSLESHFDTKLNDWTLKLLWPTVAGLLYFGAFFGAISAPKLMQFRGLRSTFLFSSGLLTISFSSAFFSQVFDSAELFIFHRLVAGVGIGMITTVQTVYLTEVSPVRYRGFMGTLTGFSTSVGFVLASALGLPQVLGQDDRWHFAYILELCPTVVLIVAFLTFLPASPIEILKNGKAKEALVSLEEFHSKPAAISRLAQLEHELDDGASDAAKSSSFSALWSTSRNALFMSLLLNATVSFSGITAASFFGTFLLQNIGFTDNGAALANCLASLSGLAGNLLGSLAIDRVGRRLLIIGCLAALALLNTALMGMVFVFQITDDNRTGFAFLAIFTLFLFVFSLGVGPMAWFLATELSVARFRARIQSLSVSCQYLTCFVSSMIFLPLYNAFGPLSFVIFIAPLTFCALYLFIFLPETKNRPIEDIVTDLKRGSLIRRNAGKVEGV